MKPHSRPRRPPLLFPPRPSPRSASAPCAPGRPEFTCGAAGPTAGSVLPTRRSPAGQVHARQAPGQPREAEASERAGFSLSRLSPISKCPLTTPSPPNHVGHTCWNAPPPGSPDPETPQVSAVFRACPASRRWGRACGLDRCTRGYGPGRSLGTQVSGSEKLCRDARSSVLRIF